jgi:hypothetical protein
MGQCEKYSRAGQVKDNNMAHGHCILDAKDYKHTLRIYIYYFYTAAKFYANTPQYSVYTFLCLSCRTCIYVCNRISHVVNMYFT